MTLCFIVKASLNLIYLPEANFNKIYDGVEAETRKSQASFQIIPVSSEALPTMRLELSENKHETSLLRSQHHH